MKRCSSSSVVREMPIKSTVSYQFTPTRMKELSDSNKRYRRHGEIGCSSIAVETVKKMQPLWRAVWKLLSDRRKQVSAQTLAHGGSRQWPKSGHDSAVQLKFFITNKWTHEIRYTDTLEYYSAT